MPEWLMWSIVVSWFACAILGFIVGEQKCAGGQGMALGLIFGPLGVIAALSLDGRPHCPRCVEPLNAPSRSESSICPHCHAALAWRRDSNGNQRPQLDDAKEQSNHGACNLDRRTIESRRLDDESQRKLDALDAGATTAARPTSPEPPVVAPPPLPLPPKRPAAAPTTTTPPAGRNPSPPRRNV
jgi:hypothetical protein